MRWSIALIGAVLALTVPAVALAADRFPAAGGDIEITPIIHASVQIEHAGKVIQVDPWSAGDLSRAKPADLILVTDDVGHHLDVKAIQQLRKPGAPVVIAANGKSRVPDGIVLANGASTDAAGVHVEAIAAYDIKPGAPEHPKGEANGYVITLGEKRIYFAGVTECVPEVQALRNIDVAFMPMNIPVGRMTPEAAAACTKILKPKAVYVYHYDQTVAARIVNPNAAAQPPAGGLTVAQSLEAFRTAMRGEPTEFRAARWYPEAAPPLETATTVAFTEGPTVDRDGNVYFTDIINQRIMKLDAKGMLSVYREKSNVANGLLIDPQGRLVACEGAEFERPGVKVTGTPRVTRTDLKSGKIEVLAERYEGKPFVGPNDVTIDGSGRLYFTDLPGGAVYRIDTSGKVTRILATPDIQRPNGIQISPDDRTLYLVEANGAQGGARMIRAYDLQPDGTVRNMRVHYNFSPGRSADGMSIDSQGNLYASAGMNQLRGTSETLDNKTGVYVISPQGKLITFIPIPEDYITNNAFGGPDMKTLYVTAGKTLFKIRTEVAGLPR